jgi:ribosomal protein L11 methyltransferase
MNYWKYTLHTDPETAEMLLAFLVDSAFDTYEETPEALQAYLPAADGTNADRDQAAVESTLTEMQQQFVFTWEKTFLPGKNWNEIWESNFQPVVVGHFCAARADFHAAIPGVRYDLVINPKMAFGTGHHETTWQCLAALEHLPVAGKRLLDYGCGTGILAILASKLGAKEVEAVDIEEESYRNTIENCAVNDVHQVIPRCGTLDQVEGREFDGIMANINRNVILESLPRLNALLKPGGWMLTSGFLKQDETVMLEAAAQNDFSVQSVQQRGNWLCVLFQK